MLSADKLYSFDPDQADKVSGLIWVQSLTMMVFLEEFFQKSWFWRMQNFPVGKELTLQRQQKMYLKVSSAKVISSL